MSLPLSALCTLPGQFPAAATWSWGFASCSWKEFQGSSQESTTLRSHLLNSAKYILISAFTRKWHLERRKAPTPKAGPMWEIFANWAGERTDWERIWLTPGVGAEGRVTAAVLKCVWQVACDLAQYAAGPHKFLEANGREQKQEKGSAEGTSEDEESECPRLRAGGFAEGALSPVRETENWVSKSMHQDWSWIMRGSWTLWVSASVVITLAERQETAWSPFLPGRGASHPGQLVFKKPPGLLDRSRHP